jgi:D-tyrosyl-tRNA(Tyr) deacylase
MRAVIQRVQNASVTINNKETASINHGLLILLGIETEDSLEDVDWLINKIIHLRIFNDEQGIMNLAVTDVDGEILAVSQFTLHAKIKKGNRPSYIKAARPDVAIPLYRAFVDSFSAKLEKQVKTGEFGAYMQIHLVNDGPVTILIDTKNRE